MWLRCGAGAHTLSVLTETLRAEPSAATKAGEVERWFTSAASLQEEEAIEHSLVHNGDRYVTQ